MHSGHHKSGQGEERQITYTLGRPPTSPVRPGAVCVYVFVRIGGQVARNLITSNLSLKDVHSMDSTTYAMV